MKNNTTASRNSVSTPITNRVENIKKTPFNCTSEKEVLEFVQGLSNQEIHDWLLALSLLVVRGKIRVN